MRLRRLAAFGALGMLVALCGALWWTGDQLTRPARGPASEPPPELNARSIRFASGSGAQLDGWFIPGQRGAGAVLLLHAIRADRRSMLPRARFLAALGYAVLLVDLQAHGESEGERITFGFREAMDARSAIGKLRQLAPGEKLGAIGVSLGAAALVQSGANDMLAAAVLESMFPTLEEAIENRLRMRFGVLGPPLTPLLLAPLPAWLGFSASQVRPIEQIAKLGAAVLILHGAEDRHTTPAEARRLFGAAAQPKTLQVVSGAGHTDLHTHDPRGYEARVTDFLALYLRDANAARPDRAAR